MDGLTYLWRLLGRLFAHVPSGPDERPYPAWLPDPNEPGISAETRRARLRLLLQIHEKKSRGGGR
jgi:hypothetical protein